MNRGIKNLQGRNIYLTEANSELQLNCSNKLQEKDKIIFELKSKLKSQTGKREISESINSIIDTFVKEIDISLSGDTEQLKEKLPIIKKQIINIKEKLKILKSKNTCKKELNLIKSLYHKIVILSQILKFAENDTILKLQSEVNKLKEKIKNTDSEDFKNKLIKLLSQKVKGLSHILKFAEQKTILKLQKEIDELREKYKDSGEYKKLLEYKVLVLSQMLGNQESIIDLKYKYQFIVHDLKTKLKKYQQYIFCI